MDFSLSEEQQAIQETFHRFAEKEIRPRAAEIEEKEEFPRELFEKVDGAEE